MKIVRVGSILFLVILFIFSSYKVLYWKLDNDKSNRLFHDIQKNVVILKNKTTNEEEYIIDFANLKKKNSDVVAYLKVFGTNIEYPLVQTNDNDYYLTHSFDKSHNNAGWPFINYLNTLDGSDKNIVIFAHSRRDGSMFGTLYQTLSLEWQSNKNNHKIVFIHGDVTSYYQVFSTYRVLNEDYYLKNSFDNDDEYVKFLNTIASRSNYHYGVTVGKDDTILTLSTCDRDDRYRIVLHAKKMKI